MNTNITRRIFGDWLKVLILLLDEAAVVVLVMLVLWFFGIKIPLSITIIMAIIIGTFVFMTHTAVIRSFHRKQVTGREGMISLQGRVVEPLTPLGVIIVQGEHWKAKSIDEDMQVDEKAEIVGLDGLTLRVIRPKPKK